MTRGRAEAVDTKAMRDLTRGRPDLKKGASPATPPDENAPNPSDAAPAEAPK